MKKSEMVTPRRSRIKGYRRTDADRRHIAAAEAKRKRRGFVVSSATNASAPLKKQAPKPYAPDLAKDFPGSATAARMRIRIARQQRAQATMLGLKK